MSGALFRVLLPNGQYTRLYSKEEIRRAFLSKKISKRATVHVGGSEVRIADFLNRVIAPVATQKQKQLAECLGISFKPDINEVEISELIANALAQKAKETDSTEADFAESKETFERMQNEIRAEMLEHGSIPLSQATPDDIQNYFEYVRDSHMVILYSPDNTLEQLMQAQKTLNAGLPGGTILRICHPDSMTTNALKKLLKLAICNIPDEEADRDKLR
jgi:hypothetical protein